MTTYQIRIYEDGEINNEEPKQPEFKHCIPFVITDWPSLGAPPKMRTPKYTLFDHWPIGNKCVAFLTSHAHDGLLAYTWEAISGLTTFVEEWCTEKGGVWEISKMYIGSQPYKCAKFVGQMDTLMLVAIKQTVN